jgi:hypothetical protein
MLDDGADHNFISQEFVTKHKLQVTPLEGLDTVAYDGHSSSVSRCGPELAPQSWTIHLHAGCLCGTPWQI